MPNYKYKCHECDGQFTEFQGINEPPIKICSVCGKESAYRIICFEGNITVKNAIGGVPVQTMRKDMSIDTEIVGKNYII